MNVPAQEHLEELISNKQRTFDILSYGCQQNAADTEVVRAILEGAGYSYVDTTTTNPQNVDDAAATADIVLLNTCAIRDNAERKIWGKLQTLRNPPRRPVTKNRERWPPTPPQHQPQQRARRPTIGLLGCMAERLKTKLLEEGTGVDLVAGPDAYRDLPRLLNLVEAGEKAFNVQLSMDETYADIAPVRMSPDNISGFVSIMRGCNNMCAFCVVPHTRGRERSRPMETIEDEVRRLRDQGVKEVVLLGQNVNSYHAKDTEGHISTSYQTAEGFSNMYKLRDGSGARFVDLLERVSRVDPEVRVRFTSPHPKDFPLPLLELIGERPSICSSLHLPAQSGSTAMLTKMRRGYSREAYLQLVERAREVIPDVSLSSDFIAGFCGETEADHRETLSLLEEVGYDQAFMYAYSLRERTHAAYHYQDDVSEEVKQRRLAEIIETFRRVAGERNVLEVGREHLVLVEGLSKRSTPENPTMTGRNDNNKRCIISSSSSFELGDLVLQAGDYVRVRVKEASAQTLFCEPLEKSSIKKFHM